MIFFILGFAPGIYWLWYFYKRDTLEPEPKKLVIRSYFLGILTAVVIIIIQLPFQYSYIVGAVLVAPIVEELGKFFAVKLSVYNHKEFNEPMDGIIYASAVALGFASIENGIYLFRISVVSKYLLSNVILARSLLSVPAHALFSSIWGYALGRAKFSKSKNKNLIIIAGITLAIAFHSLFNLLCFIQIYSSIGLLILIAIMWQIINKKISKAIERSPLKRKK
ncbi:MAG: PrsW family intramembrane metalloprotease [Candidatus Cloacimonetes bacterium]|nr:PrsW family intramembrane metalloprotease [Candidatus Cloacimonadota bacterium]